MGVVVVDMVALTLIANIPAIGGSQGIPVMTLLQFIGGLVLPGAALLALFVLAFVLRRNSRAGVRVMPWVGGAAALGMIVLTGIVVVTAPPAVPTEATVAGTLTEQIALGQDLYSINCVECHGADGEGGEIKGVEGLEGFKMKPINSQDEMYTRNDSSLADIIAYGQPNLGMQPFGKAYGGEFAPGDIDAVVAFMRYTWDDRAELPAGTTGLAAVPVPNPGEVPSYDVYIQALTKRYCISCHRQGKQNNNYLMTSYDEMLNSGDNAPVMKAGEIDSLMIQLITGHESKDPKTDKVIRQMPPTKLLDQKYIDMLTLWIMSGMPKTAEEAAKLSVTPTPAGTPLPGAAPAPTPTP
jgi:mono/diheme cytochrome c family protein